MSRVAFEKAFPLPAYLVWVKVAGCYLIDKASGVNKAIFAEYRDEYNDKFIGWQACEAQAPVVGEYPYQKTDEYLAHIYDIAKLKAENERLKEALVELVSINNINADFTGRNFAWAELQLANEVLKESKK